MGMLSLGEVFSGGNVLVYVARMAAHKTLVAFAQVLESFVRFDTFSFAVPRSMGCSHILFGGGGRSFGNDFFAGRLPMGRRLILRYICFARSF